MFRFTEIGRGFLILIMCTGVFVRTGAAHSDDDVRPPADAFIAPTEISGIVTKISGISTEITGIVTDIGGGPAQMSAALTNIDSNKVKITETEKEIRIDIAADVLFDFNKANIRKDAEEILLKVGEALKKYAKMRISITGHTDSIGSNAYNNKLGQSRAESVANFFAKNQFVTRSQLSISSAGKSQPVAPNTKPDGSDDPEGRQKNRRVEIRIAK